MHLFEEMVLSEDQKKKKYPGKKCKVNMQVYDVLEDISREDHIINQKELSIKLYQFIIILTGCIY